MQGASASDYFDQPEQHLTDEQRRWLRPLGPVRSRLRRLFIAINRRLMRLLFRFTVRGLERLPAEGPLVIAPNHTSSLDGAALFAALDNATLDKTRWAGRRGAVLRHAVRRFFNRLAKTVPIERKASALAAAAAVLERGENLVWFPEGTRTTDGRLQELKPGVGLLMVRLGVPVAPVWLEGAYHALRPHTLRLRLGAPIEVRIGRPLAAADLDLDGLDDEQQVDRCVEELRRRLEALRDGQESSDGA